MHSARAPDDHGRLHCMPSEIKRNEENETIQWNTSHKSLKLQQQYQLDRELTEMCSQKQRTCIHRTGCIAQMRPTATAITRSVVCMSVSWAQRWGLEEWLHWSRCHLWVDSRKHVLDGGENWFPLANTTEWSVCGGDAALCEITLTTCFRKHV